MSHFPEVFCELDRNPSLSAYAAAARRLKSEGAALPPLRVGLLSNHTFDIAVPLSVECGRRGFGLELYTAGYDQYRQELLDPQSALTGFAPDAILLSLHFEEPPGASEFQSQLGTVIAAYRARSETPIFVLNVIPPAVEKNGLLPGSSFERVMEINRALRELAGSLTSVFIVDAALIASRFGLNDWCDRRLWFLARAGINPKKFPILASHIARCFAAWQRPAAKCLVLDLDNTVWGGVLGDAGPEGIHCTGDDYPGSAYADFQRALLGLRSRGILLAVASKNDAALVEQAFHVRTGMVLKRKHITEWEVHWGPKPESLQRIAARLNIGLDSLVFLDDNPAEVELVRMAVPAVRAYLMPGRPEEFTPFLASLEDFDQLSISAEDLRRAEMYAVRSKQRDVAVKATDLESFYRSLETVLSIEEPGVANFDRIVQLFQKTNQFNLTTRRHQKPQLKKAVDEGGELWAFRARDRHGDHGIIAVALLEFEDSAAIIDSFLMICRVVGRTIETAILHFLEQRARSRGAGQILGHYIPTAKNGPCQDFLKQHGYRCAAQDKNGSRWVLDLKGALTACPEWITIQQKLAACDQS